MENEAALQKERLDIEESREKRLARIKGKQRNRGGIFKPKEHNPLLDILMSRDVSGRSPTKVRSRSRPPSSDHEARDNVAHPRRSTSTRATDRRKSTAASASASVAGKGRKQSIGPSIKASIVQDSSTKGILLEKKRKSVITSRNTSKNLETQEISLPSKRPREDGDEQNIHIGLPSPPKRAKKNNASTAASSTTRSKPARPNRKAPAKSKPESKTKGKTRATSVDQESQEDEARPSKPKKAAVSKKNKKTSEEFEGCVEDQPSASKPKSARTAADGDKGGTKPKTKRTTARGPRKKNASDDEDGVGPKSNHENAKRRGKQKTTAESEHEIEPEEESHYRPKIPKPRLETVVEEDEEDPDLEIGIKDGNKVPLSSSRTHHGASTLQPNVLFQNQGQRRRRTAEDNVESNALQETKVPVAKKSKVAVKNSGPRAKVSSMTVEDVHEVEGKPPPNTRRKAKNSTKSSESGDNPEHSHTHPSTPPLTSRRNNSDSKKEAKSAITGPATRSKNTSKPKSKSRSKLTTKSTLKRAAPAKFANQPALLTSPIKETDNGADELDFLS